MKIKTTKQLNLPQLIEWAQDNIEEATKKVHRVNENEVLGNHVRFTEVYSDLEVRLHGYIPFDTTFTVEVEEDIDEDTIIPKMLVIGRFDGYEEVYNRKISHFNQHLLSAYLIDDDGQMELLYDEEKGMVE